MTKPLRVLFFDLETAPLLTYIWRAGQDYVPHEMNLQSSFIICWAAKWRGEKTVKTGLLGTHEAKKQDDARIVAELADLIREADIVVAHNSNRFDVPMLNARLLVLGLEPVGKVKTIDTLRLSKASFGLAYHRLDYLGEVLGLGRKIKTEFDLWHQCYQGNLSALRKMRAYNRQDVILLEQVFNKMLPYVSPAVKLVEGTPGEGDACPTCGGTDLVRRGFYRTNASTFVKLCCNDCGRYSRSRRSDLDVRMNLVPL